MKIFVSIASYRDPETIPTILDLYSKAENPDKINVGLCLQHEDNETNLDPISNLNVNILEYNWRESYGTCWARHMIQKDLLEDEDYYLQLDSHHRFCENWDTKLIDMLNDLKKTYPKPIIGGYCPGYKPEKDKDLEQKPMRICSFADFTDLGDLMFIPRTIKEYQKLQEEKINYIKARFLSGHFIFSDSIFCHECMYDPNMYFRGEELTLSARAYTNGYDFFHPTHPIIWHEYIREKQIKHWNDHTPTNGFIVTSEQRANSAKKRARQLLGMEKHNIKFGKYNIGTKRSLHEYELYAGVCFSSKQVHESAYDINDKYIEPQILSEDEWNKGLMKKMKVQFDLPAYYKQELMKKQVSSLGLFFYTDKNVLIYRKDIKKPDLYKISLDVLNLQFSTTSTPSSVKVVPFLSNGVGLENLLIRNIKVIN